MIKYIQNNLKINDYHILPSILIGFFGHFIYHIIWTYIFPQNYDSLVLRVMAMIISLSFLLKVYISKDKFLIFWFFGVCYILPFIFTTHLIINDYSKIWLMCEIGGLFMLSLFINNFILLIINLTVGVSFAILYCYLFFPEKLIFHDEYYSYIPLFIFSIFCSFLFYYNTYSLVKLKNKIFIKNLQDKVIKKSQTPLENVSKIAKLISSNIKGKEEFVINKVLLPKRLYDNILSYIDILQNNIVRGENIIDIILNNLKNYNLKYKLQPRDLQKTNAAKVIEDSLSTYHFSVEERKLIKLSYDNNFQLECNFDLQIFVIYNILQNALNYKGKIDIYFVQDENKYNQIIIKNSNSYISKDKIRNILDLNQSDNFHLGLLFSKKSMLYIEGDLDIKSSEDFIWTKVILSFPII